MMSQTIAAAAAPSAARRVQWVMIGMLLTLLAAIGLSAWAQPAPGTEGEGGMSQRMHGDMERGHMDGDMHGHMGGPDMMFRGSPQRIGRMVDFMLDGLHASDAQRSQIKQIAVQAAADLKTQMMGLRQRGMQVLTAPTIDPAAAEQVRQQMLQQHDQMSRRVMQAMLDVAKVLTPEQRATIGERMRDRQARMEDRMQRMQKDAPHR